MKMIIINGMRVYSSPLQSAGLDRLLDELRPGTTRLTVPLVADIVQVGIGGDFETTTVAVSATNTAVRVRRVDGRRLQVHIVENWTDASSPGVATPVFDEPVEELVLERCDGHWVFGSRMRARPTELDRFVGTLTRFALAKQLCAGGLDQAAGAA
ncbi:hypothetical protein GCM10009632_16880 [Mycolicibacterium alvei]|jgi:hypothetical protein|uniref:Uncharacterized protein n=2 Tax=Mycolicibacterium alvei TaxID=67081 RepID=A0A6N4UVW4_9MYCO|nr:hypothetical protein MALV_36930 [Mycolicibacterium alvei]